MRLIKLSILLISISGSTSAQEFIDTMYFSGEWEQSIREKAEYYRIISSDTSGEFRFLVEDFYFSGQIQMSGTYKSIRPDNKDGHFIYYNPLGGKQMECHYRNNLLHGPYEEWYDSGQKKVSQYFNEDKLDGPFSSWREDGTSRLQAHYSEGVKNGSFISYYTNGQKARKDLYEKDQLIEGQCFTTDGEPTDYFPYIKMPEFPGSREGILKFIENELIYPQEARRQRQQGAVIVLFTVDEEGNVQNPVVVEGDIASFNQEALRIAAAMPRWIPGEVDAVPSPMQVSIPIEFSLL